jgi:hypothetical protein
MQHCVLISALLSIPFGNLLGAEAVELQEGARDGSANHVIVELSAKGRYRPMAPPDQPQPKPLDFNVETRFDFIERAIKSEPGEARRVVRKAIEATAAVNGQIPAWRSSLRPDVAILVAARREDGVFSYSPAGPLTQHELELVQAPGDPLGLGGLLPAKLVTVGDTWPVSAASAKALSDYDALASNSLQAKLESLDSDSAVVRIAGEIRGAVRGGEGRMTCEGSYRFDRKAGLIARLTLNRAEVRRPGPVEAGLDAKGTLTVERRASEIPAELTDAAVSGLPLHESPSGALLRFSSPEGKYSLLHDRDWHIFAEDTRRAVLKRLDHGEVVAQCNLAVGPKAGKGRHQDPAQFRDDIRQALGNRYGRIIGEGEVEGAPAGGYRYKIAIEGQEGNVGILWYYYLVASPEGDQLLVVFTLTEAQAKSFGDQDLQLIGSLEWHELAKGR